MELGSRDSGYSSVSNSLHARSARVVCLHMQLLLAVKRAISD